MLYEQEEEEEEEHQDIKIKKKSKKIDKEFINSTFILLDDIINKEILKIRENTKIINSVKTFRIINKNLKKIHIMIAKLLKNKKTNNNNNNTNNSGFMKLNNISNELSIFMNLKDKNEQKSRVDVTKYICNYIKSNNLQNPTDKREILPNLELQKLFRIDCSKIKYYNIQTFLKIHFPKKEELIDK